MGSVIITEEAIDRDIEGSEDEKLDKDQFTSKTAYKTFIKEKEHRANIQYLMLDEDYFNGNEIETVLKKLL